MSKSRRQFLAATSFTLLGAAAASLSKAQVSAELPPGSPSAFGTGIAVGPEVTVSTFAEAEKLVQVAMSDSERAMAASSWRKTMAGLYERRTGPRKVVLEPTLAPASRWDPVLPGQQTLPRRNQFIRSKADPGPLPNSDEDIAFASVTRLSRWIEARKLSSQRLTSLYLERLERFNPKLRCVIRLTRELALSQAKKADEEIAAGNYRGPLHGIPWGTKDLLDTAGIPTTYGAEPFRNRIPTEDAVVVKRLNDAGAVLVAKLSLGALALNDIWFGRTDHESMAAGRRRVRFERRAGRRNGGRVGGLRHRKRNRRQHRKPVHALWDYRIASHIRSCAAHWRDDVVLVAR